VRSSFLAMPEYQSSPRENDFPFEAWCGIPVVGFDRNQPLRRYLSRTGRTLAVHHLDPGVIYRWPGQRVIRRSSVESWIETCSELFPGEGIRDFWETVWNVAVCAWDFIDTLGQQPWKRPNPVFPFLNPDFWRGARRYRLLFADSKDYIAQFSVKDPTSFLHWIETVVRFQFGAGLESIPFGMVALALNAPSESYQVEINQKGYPEEQERESFRGAWRIPFVSGEGWDSQGCPVHQVFFDPPLPELLAQTAVLTRQSSGEGFIFLRSQPDTPDPPDELISSLEQALCLCLGQRWGSLNSSSVQKVPARPVSVGLPVEPEWPWLGCVRSLLQWGEKDKPE